MKIIDEKMLKELKQNSIITDENETEDDNMTSINTSHINDIHEFDIAKTRVLKYICFKKRTEHEVRNKFAREIESDLLDEVITNLKSIGYINDENYIDRAVNEFTALNNLSIKEVKYKLYSKGIKSNVIEDYIDKNIDKMIEYELKSAGNIVIKKSFNMEKEDIKKYLIKKGYKSETIKEVI